MDERISTGVPGLDAVLNGGLIGGRVYLLKGGPGVGKTTLGMHFAMAGVAKGESVLYVTLEELAANIRADFGRMGFPVNDPRFNLIDATPTVEKYVLMKDPFETFAEGLEALRNAVVECYREVRYSRIVIDPITMLKLPAASELDYRREFLAFMKSMARLRITVLMTSELEGADVEEYLADGVVEMLTFESHGRLMRGIQVKKLRGSSFDPAIHPYEITDRGIVVYHDRLLTDH